jgi:hypothetical protein
MLETTEVNSRSTLQVALGFLLGILACVGCFFVSILLAGVLGLRDPWMFVLLNAAALVTTGLMALRNIHKSSYPDGALIAISQSRSPSCLISSYLQRRCQDQDTWNNSSSMPLCPPPTLPRE